MAHWGIAYAIGPNYNKDWEAFDAAELAEALGHRSRGARSRCAAGRPAHARPSGR